MKIERVIIMENMAKEIAKILSKKQDNIFELWNKQIILRAKTLAEIVGVDEIKNRTRNMIDLFIRALQKKDDESYEFDENMHELLKDLTRKMTVQNITPSETAAFMFSMKDAVFPILRENFQGKELADAIIEVGQLIEQLGITTFEIYLESREEIIAEQQKVFMEVAVPVVKVWNKIIMIPLVGMLDSERTQLMMESMLTALEDMQSKVVILDISGIPVVDTLVARHLITAASAVRLMGAECIITGIRARIAQTLVQLGVDLGGFMTRTTLADGLQSAIELTGQKIGD
jgi:rsbT co-antagonist protein RsbR